MARRWFSRKGLTLESEEVDVIVQDSTRFKLNGLRILTTNDTSSGPPGPPGAPGSQGIPGIPTSLAVIGGTPNANGASLSGSTLNLEPANGSFGGVVTTSSQTFSGQKTFSNAKFLLPGVLGNLPPDPSDQEFRVIGINVSNGELGCYPFWVDSGEITLNSGTITGGVPAIGALSIGFLGQFCGQVVVLLIGPSGSNTNTLVTSITGSPTQVDMTGPLTLPEYLRPNFNVHFIAPFMNNGIVESALWTVTALGKVTVELIPSAVFTPPFGIGTLNVSLPFSFLKF